MAMMGKRLFLRRVGSRRGGRTSTGAQEGDAPGERGEGLDLLRSGGRSLKSFRRLLRGGCKSFRIGLHGERRS